MLDERRDADDRVVAPVIGFSELPEMQPRGEERPVYLAGELLRPCMQRFAARGGGRRLYDAGPRVGFHHPDEPSQAVARHDAVGVQHYHVAVISAPAAAE